MSLRRPVVCFGMMLLFTGIFSGQAQSAAVPGQYLVQLRKGHASLRVEGASVREVVPGTRIHRVLRPVGENTEFALKALTANPAVERAEPNAIYTLSRTPNDPEFPKLWGLKNVGQQMTPEGPAGEPGMDIDAEAAWDIETGSPDLLVAVIDTGVDTTSADLIENLWVNEREKNGQPGVDDDGNGFVDDVQGYNFADEKPDPMDDNGHGSHVAHTIAARGNDGSGLVGVAWNVRILPVKFLSADGHGSLETAIRAIDYAVRMGARILNNSWGGGPRSEFLEEAIRRAQQAGALFVAAAGNDGENNDVKPTYPASYDVSNVLSVAAINSRGQLASYSNFGKKSVDIAAPGTSIWSNTPMGYKLWSGTSMATPHVTGVAALLWSHEPQLTAEQVRERIMRTSRPLDSLRGKLRSGGLVNARTTLTETIPPPSPNDPRSWKSSPVVLASTHPYAHNTTVEFEASVEGAREISVHFTRLKLERGFDRLYFYDAQGKLAGFMTGDQTDAFSPAIPGDRVRILLVSDETGSDYGFEADRIAFR